jgi:hypothetical protein
MKHVPFTVALLLAPLAAFALTARGGGVDLMPHVRDGRGETVATVRTPTGFRRIKLNGGKTSVYFE